MSRRRTIVVVLLASVCASTPGGAQTSVGTEDRTRVLIEMTAATQLSNDYAVTKLRIRNRSGRDRSWTFDFRAHTASPLAQGGRTSQFVLDVADQEDRVFELLIPLGHSSGGSWVQMRAFGHGVTSPGQMQIVLHTVVSAVARTAAASLSHQEAIDIFGPTGDGQILAVDPAALTTEVRAYAGLKQLWLASEEWDAVPPPVRRALMEWIANGGVLVLVEGGASLDAERAFRRHGIGTIATLPAGVTAADAAAARGRIESVPTTDRSESLRWVSGLVEPIRTHKGLLSLVLLGYLILACPVNLFVLSPKTKRVRLFWTMPAIALAASAVLGVVIVLQDGLGGTGTRAGFVYLQPELNRELLVQEQVSRTGALVARSFEVDEPIAIAALPATNQVVSSELDSRDGRYSGDWFRSRSIQAQRIRRTRATRARIETVGTDGGKPVVLSSIDAPLDALYVLDRERRCWNAVDVTPGRPVTLTKCSPAKYEEWWRAVTHAGAGPEIRWHLASIYDTPGAFLATSSDVEGVLVDTLSSIDWTDMPVVYAGHVEMD